MRIKLTLALLACCLMASAHTPYTSSRIYWDIATIKDVYHPAGYSRVRQLQDGTLMWVAVEYKAGTIFIMRSSDNGDTWSERQDIAIPNEYYGYHNAELIQLADGTLIAGYGARPKDTTKPFKHKYFTACVRSLDNGKTWGDEIIMYDDTSSIDGIWEPAFLELPSGELQCYFADESIFPNSSEQRIAIQRSWDKGLTWSKPETISFRAGHRDGMPVPLLLADGKTIAVAIEDNGAGGTPFRQVIVRTDTADNWHSGYVTGDSDKRNECYSRAVVPATANAAAPYIAMLPTGEIVQSFQGNLDGRYWEAGDMYVGVGNADARDFKDLEQVFHTDFDKHHLWNSVSVLNDGTVLAIGGLQRRNTIWDILQMCKGYPKNHFEAIYSPTYIDGQYKPKRDTWTHPDGEQIPLGCSRHFRWTADMTYSKHYLNCMFNLTDTTQLTTYGATNDGVYVYIDTRSEGADMPDGDCYRLFFDINGDVLFAKGEYGSWTTQTLPTPVRCKTTRKSYSYRVTAAIPWSLLGITDPEQATVSVAFERFDRTSATKFVKDGITDAAANQPWTWVPLQLGPMPTDVKDTDDKFDYDDPSALPTLGIDDPNNKTYDLLGRYADSGIVISNGQKYRMVETSNH